MSWTFTRVFFNLSLFPLPIKRPEVTIVLYDCLTRRAFVMLIDL